MTTLEIPELTADNVRIQNVNEVRQKINKLIDGTRDKLQIITDFDRTISKHEHNGQLTKSSYAVFELVPSLPKAYGEKANAIYNHFRVYEEDPKMSVKEKIPHMEEWWRQNERLFIDLPYDESEIEVAVKNSNVHLRTGVEAAFVNLEKSAVPVLVFSAGLGSVVKAILKHYNILSSNIHVISNFFTVQDGKITGFSSSPLHIYNKNSHAVENSDYFKDKSHRPNVILLGDSLGDANMDEGVPGDGVVLKIGFLSIHVDDYLPQYLDKFDIVLLNDQTMTVFNALLDKIL